MTKSNFARIFGISALGLILLSVAGAFLIRPYVPALLQKSVPRIERAATEVLGASVKFDSIEPRLNFLRPEFVFHGMKILDAKTGAPVLQIQTLSVQVDVVTTLLTRKPHFGKVALAGADLEVVQKAGAWSVTGIAPQGGTREFPPSWISPRFDLEISKASARLVPEQASAAKLLLSEVHAALSANPGLFRVELKSGAIAVEAPGMWPEKREWKRFQAVLELNPEQGLGGTVVAREILIEAPELTLKGELQSRPGNLKLRAAIPSVDLLKLRHLIPASWLSAERKLQIDETLKQGSAREIALLAEGNPEAPSRMHLELSFGFENLGIRYLERWPEISGAAGKASLSDHALDFRFEQAETGKIHHTGVSGHIPDLLASPPMLNLTSHLTAEKEAVAEFLFKGPFQESAASLSDYLEPTASMNADLMTDIPLGSGGGGVHGQLMLNDFGMRNGKWEIPANKIHGALKFSSTEIATDGLDAEVLGKPFHIGGTQRFAQGGSSDVRLQAVVPLAKLASFAPTLPLEKFTSGELPVSVEIKLASESEKPTGSVELDSDLLGLQIGAPFPFGKAAPDKIASHFHTEFQSGAVSRVQARLKRISGDSASWNLDYRGGEKPRISASGELAHASAPEWTDFIDQVKKARKELQKNNEDEKPGPDPVLDAALKIALFEAMGVQWHETDLRTQAEGERWSAKIFAKEVAGEIEYLRSKPFPAMNARLDYLVLAKLPGSAAESGGGAAKLNPKDLPSLQLRCERLELAGEKLGAVQAKLTQKGTALQLDEFSLKNQQFEIITDEGETLYQPAVKTSVTGRVMVHGYERKFEELKIFSSVALGRGRVAFDVSWPGGPEDFSLKALSGDFRGRVQKGTLLDMKTSFDQKLNLMSFNLTDMADRTLRFRNLAFDLSSDQGRVHTKWAKTYFGPTFLKLIGKTDTIEGMLDMRFLVTRVIAGDIQSIDPDEPIPVTQEEILNDAAEHPDPDGSALKYRVSGSWNDPKVE